MSRVYQKPAPAAGTARRPAANPQGTVRPTLHHPQSTAATRGVRAPIRGQTMRTSLPRPTGMDNHLSETNQQRQTTTSTTHVGFVRSIDDFERKRSKIVSLEMVFI